MKRILIILCCFNFYSCSVYNNLSEEDKLMYGLEKINLQNHKEQTDSLIYSINSEEIKHLIKSSLQDYQLIIIFSLTCPVNRELLKEFEYYIPKIKNTEIFLIAQNDQIFKYSYNAYFPSLTKKRYMLNSEKYSLSVLDAYSQSNEAKVKFISELCTECTNTIGTFVLLFDKECNLLFYTNREYGKNLWHDGIDVHEFRKAVCAQMYSDIFKITDK